ncbi:hypothetical protein L3556_09140 [Candidatus Synechococcus calcipolaris G9]|uniref:Uncharacterized protein n=1 Tax=Candidatus Synechococcus calcipolaris G9 TaxID=1497997 RepID=A0ABT6EZT7_9SYNE|nr:hypothetical protein [Candidatus Synechococcus calcipolaris]MDG2991088.1 hypothetical protein [Candidatus Synechococcus calcipolaris G9]
MNVAQLRQKIDYQLNNLSPQWLILISNFLDSIQSLTSKGEIPDIQPTAIKRDNMPNIYSNMPTPGKAMTSKRV